MKTFKAVYGILFFAGTFAMGFFGSEIASAIGPSKSWAWHVILPGYSVGLIMISAAMVTQLASQVKQLQSKVEKLESNQT
jgi:X-X-X-Leu-X-X-Gly heptad repeat protein